MPIERFPDSPRRASMLAAGAALAAASAALADDGLGEPGAMLQWFEATRNTIEYRMPDFFVAGYESVWLPPVSRARDIRGPGYDPFDRFDLGKPGLDQFGVTRETGYGTLRDFDAMVEQFHRANACVYIDTILNHNSGRQGDIPFLEEGDYPQFWIKGSSPGFWGDFHDGTTQSQSPCDPGYNLFEGDLVGLVDIDTTAQNWTIRQPTDPNIPEGIQASEAAALGDPRRVPQGTRYDIPSEDNRRFYPDLSLAPDTIVNPGYNRIAAGFGCGGCCFPLFPATNLGQFSLDIHPYNLDDPMAGDPVPENATALLVRWCRWMLETRKIDGFRLDAAKHMPQGFWDEHFDTHVHDRWRKPDGSLGTPFSFVEATSGNFEVYNEYVRLDGFGNRDSLDLSGAGNIRNIIGAKGAASAGDLINGHIDSEDDGFNNGTVGVNHIHSHDNGSSGDGGSAPDVPFEDKVAPWAYAYLLMRTGPPIVYHNAREFHAEPLNRFWPREGVSIALGYGSMQKLPGPVTVTEEDDRITTLVRLRNRYARNFFIPKVQDLRTFIFTRRGNCVVGVCDTFSQGYEERTFNTEFAPGTRLHELTGNAMDPVIDPTDDIFDVVTVQGNGDVTIRVPRNVDSNGDEHNSGYVVYGPATPSGTLSITPTGARGSFSVIPPDGPGTIAFARRLTEITIVNDTQLSISLDTQQTDPMDSQTDDTAIFRFNQGYVDLNANGLPTRVDGVVDQTENSGEFRAYENFVTTNDPLFGGGSGLYEQTIDATLLPEGMNYLSVIAFREGGGAFGDPLYNEWREVLYVDTADPDVVVEPDLNCLTGTGNIRILNPDGTATRVHAFLDLDPEDPTPGLGPGNQAIDWDRGEWLFPVSGLSGTHTIRVVMLEEPGGVFVRQAEMDVEFTIDDIPGDVNGDSLVDLEDLYAFEGLAEYECRADLNADEVNDEADRVLLREEVGTDEVVDMLTGR